MVTGDRQGATKMVQTMKSDKCCPQLSFWVSDPLTLCLLSMLFDTFKIHGRIPESVLWNTVFLFGIL